MRRRTFIQLAMIVAAGAPLPIIYPRTSGTVRSPMADTMVSWLQTQLRLADKQFEAALIRHYAASDDFHAKRAIGGHIAEEWLALEQAATRLRILDEKRLFIERQIERLMTRDSSFRWG